MLRSATAGVVIVLGLGATRLAAQSPAPVRELRDALPSDATMELLAVTPDNARTYFRNSAGEIWLYDRKHRTATRLVGENAWDLSLSPARDALVYTKAGLQPNEQHVWALPLVARTGLAAGPQRRLSSSAGDAPSISPDGKSVAFARDDASGVGQSIVVVPIAGGTERVVAAALPSSVANIRWTPDGKTLYFGVNPPVECVPEWSCLPLSAPYRRPPGTIRRVAVAGGPVSVVVTAKGLWPGLSPDGTTLAYIDTGSARRWAVADADGHRRGTFVLDAKQAAVGWLRGSTVLIASTGQVRRLRSFELASRRQRLLLETADPVFEPSWSPDGRAISLVGRAGEKAELRILDADGAPRKILPLPERFVDGTAWSPDLRWIGYTGYADDGSPHVSAVEISTGKVVQLHAPALRATVVARWLADSRGVVLAEMPGGSDSDRRVAFRSVALDGRATLLREVPLGASPMQVVAIDERSALIVRGHPRDYRVIALTGDSAERPILPEQPGFTSIPVLSADRSWVAVRRNPRAADNTQMDIIELLRTDGSARTTIRLPFFALPGTAMHIGPGGRELIVAENRRTDGDPGVFLVTTATQAVEKLTTYSWRNAPPEFAMSSGRTVLLLGWEAPSPAVFTLDLASRRRPGNRSLP